MKYPLLLVQWEDHSEDPRWQTVTEVSGHEPIICTTIGWLVSENRKTIKLCNSIIEADDTVGGTSMILKKNIVSREEIEF